MAKFSTREARKELKGTKRSRLLPGIYEGIYLEEILIGATPNGNQYMDFNFVKKDEDRVAYQRIWFPNGKMAPRDGESQEETDQREINEKIAHILTIMECYMTSDEAEIDANSFEGFCKQAKDKIYAKKYDEQELRIKLIPDSDLQYAEFPRYPNYIETVVKDAAPRVRFSKWELENRVTPYRSGREAPVGDSPMQDARKDRSDDLPF